MVIFKRKILSESLYLILMQHKTNSRSLTSDLSKTILISMFPSLQHQTALSCTKQEVSYYDCIIVYSLAAALSQDSSGGSAHGRPNITNLYDFGEALSNLSPSSPPQSFVPRMAYWNEQSVNEFLTRVKRCSELKRTITREQERQRID